MERKLHEKKGVTYDDMKQYRLKKEKPVLEGFWNWVDDQKPSPNTRFHKAIVYIQNRRPYLETYLENEGCSFNNTSKISCKAFVSGRKNWLFSDSTKGANVSAVPM